jgi:acetyltransferase-like isoleucine patch superfamily enzyme/acyl carrier protein
MNLVTRIKDAVTRTRLRGVTRIGQNAKTAGAPYIKNRGTIEIGGDFFLSSEPIVSHIVVSRGARVTIGNGVVIGSGAAIACEAEIAIGNGVRIGRNVMILDTDFHDAASMDAPGTAVPVVIEDDVRIDDGVVVLKGARIGKGAWIAASSVVSGVVPPGVFASGVPARVRREKKGHDGRRDSGDVAERVRAVIAETFDVQRPLEPTDGPAQIVRWDSLGSLRLLLALEDEFGLHLPENALYGVASVAAVVGVVDSALDAS